MKNLGKSIGKSFREYTIDKRGKSQVAQQKKYRNNHKSTKITKISQMRDKCCIIQPLTVEE